MLFKIGFKIWVQVMTQEVKQPYNNISQNQWNINLSQVFATILMCYNCGPNYHVGVLGRGEGKAYVDW
jgi:hypothetical protein